jgi:hypothetical protein
MWLFSTGDAVRAMSMIWGPKQLDSCDILSKRGDTRFGREVPFIERFNIHVKPLEHESI